MTQAKRFVLIMNASDRSKATAAPFATHVGLPIPALESETGDAVASGGARVANTLDGC